MQLHLDMPSRAASQDLRALWSYLYRLTERLNATVFADRPDADVELPDAIAPEEESAGQVPVDHSSSDNTYGQGGIAIFGHVQLSDDADESLTATDGTAATPAAVSQALAAALDQQPLIQHGVATTKFGSSFASTSVTFPQAYAAVPFVMVSQVFNDANLVVHADSVSTTGFSTSLGGTFTTSGTRPFQWLAIGMPAE